jgi:hypothetical protein
MATTTNYSWTTPDDTSLVKDGAAAIRSLGTSIDTTTKNLNPSTTLGDIEYRSSSANTNTRLGIGTTGQVLTVAAGVPSWATLSAGGMTQLATGNLSGSAQVRLQSIPGTYKSLVLFVRNQRYTNTNATWGMRLMNDSTANRYASQSSGQSTSETFRYDQVYCTTDLSNTAGDGMSLFEITDYSNTTTWKMFKMLSIGNNKTTSTSIQLGEVLGAYNQTGAVTEVDICSVLSGGNFTAGTYTLYGVN